MNLGRILQVVVVIATIGCSCCSAQAGAGLACSGPQLDDIVHKISRARFETRDTKPKLAQCRKFVELIRGQQELESAGLAIDEPRGQLAGIAKLLELRASCPGRPMGGLGPLQEFTDDCLELIELAACGSQPTLGTHEVVKPPKQVGDKTNDLVEELKVENARLLREVDGLRHLEIDNTKLSQELDELKRLRESSSGQDKSKIEQLTLESKKLQESLADQKRTNGELSKQKGDLSRELDESRRSNEREKETNRELTKKVAQQSRSINELHSNEAEHEVKIQMLEGANKRLSGELSALQEQLKKQTKAAQTAVQAAPGATREIVIRKGADGALGMHWVEDIYGGVFVTEVSVGSPAARAGLRFGDQLIQVNGLATVGRHVSNLIQGANPVKFLVRKSPMEQTFVMKRKQGERAGINWSRWHPKILDVHFDGIAAQAGLLEKSNFITVNGMSIIGMDGAVMTNQDWWPVGEFTVTTMPSDFFTKLTEDLGDASLDRIRDQMNKNRS